MLKLRLFPALCLAAAALALGGCGSGSSGSTAATDSVATPAGTSTKPAGQTGRKPQGSQDRQGRQANTQSSPTTPEEPAHFEPPVHHDSGGGVQQFEQKAGDNSIQETGSEASAGEFAEAAATLHAFLDARAARAWKAACAQMSPAVVKELVGGLGSAEGKGADCAEVLSNLTAAVPDASLRQAATADVGALRVEGDRGFILFRGPGGQSFFMPMAREGGHWKVAAIAASPLL